MHHCLEVSEILLQIVDEVAGHVSDREHWKIGRYQRRMLASMARTCKLFYEPAMDALWEVLFEVDHLLACVCMPPGQFLGADTQPNSTSSTLRCITNAGRVRSFSADDLACRRLIENMDLVRRLITTSGSFLPNLQNLNIVMKYSNAESVYAAVDLLLSPSIRSLAFHTGSSGPGDHHELLERAGRICPHITYLNAAASLSHPFALSSFSRLEDFVSHDALPAEALAHLASLDTVHALDIAPPNPQASSLLLHRGSFAFLRTLFMCCSPFLNDRPFIAPFLRAISSQTLQSVSIFTRIHSSHDNDLTYLSELISAISNFASLRYFQLTAGCKTWGGDCDLLPLQRLRRLKSLSLSLDRIVPNFTDSSLPQYGAAWPEIEDLRVVYITERLSDLERRTTLTLAALSAFAQHFPRLESFRGHLDARAIDTSVDLQHLPSTLRLVNLDIRNSLAGEDTKAIAAYISAVCPFGYLTSIHDSYVPEAELDREHEKAWSAVEQIVNHVAGARR